MFIQIGGKFYQMQAPIVHKMAPMVPLNYSQSQFVEIGFSVKEPWTCPTGLELQALVAV